MLPAAAAGIAMAAEVSAGIKIDVNAVSYDAGSKTFEALKTTHHNNDWESPISFSISGEKAGATYHICEGGGTDINSSKWNIWVKPIDMLTINVGHWDSNLNQETIYYGGTQSGIGSQGLTFTLAPIDGFSADVTFAPGYGTAWFSKADSADPVIKELGVKFQYAADFGTVNAIFDYKGKTLKSAATEAGKKMVYTDSDGKKHDIKSLEDYMTAVTKGYPVTEEVVPAEDAVYNPQEMKFGVGYKNTFDPLTLWVNALGFVKGDKFDAVRAEAFQEVGIDALKVKAFEAFQFNTNKADDADLKDKIDIAAFLYLGYSLGDATAYLKIKDEDFLADFKMIINPGVEFKVGDCSIDAGVEVTAQEKIKIDVPVKFSMSF